jgi:imidazole glycerol-phosphate synthase
MVHHRRPSQLLHGVEDRRVYFVNSYRATPSDANSDWTLATSSYGGGDFVAAVGKGNVYATQFHPEKSGTAGLDILRNFLGPLNAELPEPVSRSSECSASCSLLWALLRQGLTVAADQAPPGSKCELLR